MNKKICILYTGGTIGMVPTANGYEVKTYGSGKYHLSSEL